MKKFLFITFLFCTAGFGYAQQGNSTYFGQCMIDIESNDELAQLEATMRQNPYLKVVRLDAFTKRAFILTNAIEGLTVEQFSSWFNEYSDNVRCVQIGVHGVDMIKPYPFEGCEN